MRPKNRKEFRIRRHLRIRKRVHGTAERPRMAIHISNRRFQVQFIDDDAAVTLAATTSTPDDGGSNRATAKIVGTRAAEAATARGIRDVLVDRGGFRFHGCLREIVETAVSAGLNIRRESVKQPKGTEAS